MRANPRPLKIKSPEELLKNIPKVSKPVVAQWRELEKKLEKFGVETKPRYTLSPPFGGVTSIISTE